jgi:hypothetical protein
MYERNTWCVYLCNFCAIFVQFLTVTPKRNTIVSLNIIERFPAKTKLYNKQNIILEKKMPQRVDSYLAIDICVISINPSYT